MAENRCFFVLVFDSLKIGWIWKYDSIDQVFSFKFCWLVTTVLKRNYLNDFMWKTSGYP